MVFRLPQYRNRQAAPVSSLLTHYSVITSVSRRKHGCETVHLCNRTTYSNLFPFQTWTNHHWRRRIGLSLRARAWNFRSHPSWHFFETHRGKFRIITLEKVTFGLLKMLWGRRFALNNRWRKPRFHRKDCGPRVLEIRMTILKKKIRWTFPIAAVKNYKKSVLLLFDTLNLNKTV